MIHPTPAQVREYLAGLALANEHEIQELRSTPVETKLQQLRVLMGARELLENPDEREAGVREVRERWARLHRALSAEARSGCVPPGPGRPGALESSTTLAVRVRLPQVEDLMIMKAIAQRPQDLRDIEGLLDAHPDANVDRVMRWVREFSQAMAMPDILAGFEKLLMERKRGSRP